MPITKSAKEALHQSRRKRVFNLRRIKEMKETIKKTLKLVKENKKDEVEKILPKAYQAIDKAAKKGIIKKNTAGRKKSRLAKAAQKITA